LEILLCLKIRQNSGAGVGVGHDFTTLVDKTLFKHFLKDIPNGLHETHIHGFVIAFEVDPSTKSANNILPL